MSYIVKYQKYITRDIYRVINVKDEQDFTDLCTIDGWTYVHSAEIISDVQQEGIVLIPVTLTEDLKIKLKKASTHVWLVDQRVRDKSLLIFGIEEYDRYKHLDIVYKDQYIFKLNADRRWGDMRLDELGLL